MNRNPTIAVALWLVWLVAIFFILFAATRTSAAPPAQSRDAMEKSIEPTLELRGIKLERDGPRFNLFDADHDLDCWLRLNDTHRGYKLTLYRPAENSLTLVSPAHVITLVLAKGRIADASYLLPAPPPTPAIPDLRQPTASMQD
jgi:hypothetical protein